MPMLTHTARGPRYWSAKDIETETRAVIRKVHDIECLLRESRGLHWNTRNRAQWTEAEAALHRALIELSATAILAEIVAETVSPVENERPWRKRKSEDKAQGQKEEAAA